MNKQELKKLTYMKPMLQALYNPLLMARQTLQT